MGNAVESDRCCCARVRRNARKMLWGIEQNIRRKKEKEKENDDNQDNDGGRAAI